MALQLIDNRGKWAAVAQNVKSPTSHITYIQTQLGSCFELVIVGRTIYARCPAGSNGNGA